MLTLTLHSRRRERIPSYRRLFCKCCMLGEENEPIVAGNRSIKSRTICDEILSDVVGAIVQSSYDPHMKLVPKSADSFKRQLDRGYATSSYKVSEKRATSL